MPQWSAGPAMDSLKDRPQKILVDNSVLAHRCFSYTGPSGHKRGWLIQEHSYTEEFFQLFNQPRFWQDRGYFYGIRELAVSGRVRLFDSYELLMERLTHPMGRFAKVGSIHVEDVFEGAKFETLNQYNESLKISPESAMRSQREMHRRGGGVMLTGDQPVPEWLMPDVFDTYRSTNERMAGYEDPLYQSLLDALGGKKITKDAWHIVTAERYSLDCFMTMDYKLIDRMNQLRNKEPVRSLSVRVNSPAEWGRQHGVQPIHSPDLVGELAGRRKPNPYYRMPADFVSEETAMQELWREFVGESPDDPGRDGPGVT